MQRNAAADIYIIANIWCLYSLSILAAADFPPRQLYAFSFRHYRYWVLFIFHSFVHTVSRATLPLLPFTPDWYWHSHEFDLLKLIFALLHISRALSALPLPWHFDMLPCYSHKISLLFSECFIGRIWLRSTEGHRRISTVAISIFNTPQYGHWRARSSQYHLLSMIYDYKFRLHCHGHY